MSDHEFERQVRQKLNHFKMDPSAKAWVNIEDAMRGQKRRRKPLLLIPVLVLGLASGGFMLYRHGYKAGASDSRQVILNKQMNSHKELPVVPSPFSDHPTDDFTAQQDEKTPTLVIPGNGEHAGGPDKFKSASRHTVDPDFYSIEKSPLAASSALPDVAMAEGAGASLPNRYRFTGLPDKKIDVLSALDASTLLNKLEQETLRTRPVPAPSLTTAQKTGKKSSKWSLGFSAYAGISAVNKGNLLNFKNPQVEDVSYSAAAPYTMYRANLPPTYNTPSSISPGFAFTAGPVVQREISKRLFLSAGLNYAQFNTLSRVGQKINGSQVVNNGTGYLYVQNYYLVDENQTTVYKNRYHFVELPVGIQYRINRNATLPIYLNGGVVVSRLIKSTSLHFDGTTGVYYKNDRLINQTQAGLTTGISFELFSKTSAPLRIGPLVRSNLSTILRKEVSENKHFNSIGLDLRMFIR